MLLTVILIVVALAGLYFILPYALRKMEQMRLARTCAERRAIVLTYNDGPNPLLTPQLLDILKKHDARATFYANGRHIEQHPEILRKTLEDGHVVGSYTYNTFNAWTTDPVRTVRDIDKGIQVTSKFGGDRYAFRTPYGKLTIISLAYGLMRGLKYGWWSIDSKDSWNRRPIADILQEIQRKNGGVILMHDNIDDNSRHAPSSENEYVLDLTAAILHFSRQNGFRIVSYASLDWKTS